MNLSEKLTQIDETFDTKRVLSRKTDKEYIKKYYKVNRLAYSFLHTRSDRMYMGISRGDELKDDDLLEGAKLVAKYIKKLGAKNVLELASGRGANSLYLAEQSPAVAFNGVELSPGQIVYAKRKTRRAKNYKPQLGDYHDLRMFADSSIDLVFVVEALCYSVEKVLVLREVWRVLRPNGIFIVLDGYLGKPTESLTGEEKLGKRLTEIGMAVENFESYTSFIKMAEKEKFEITEEEDVSKLIMPTLRRFEKLADGLFKRKLTRTVITKVFPSAFTYNAISATLMPKLFEKSVFVYWTTALEKRG